MRQKIFLFAIFLTGGGKIALNAIELSQLCQSGQNCTINTPQSEVTNYGSFNHLVEIKDNIDTFTNYGFIKGIIYSGSATLTLNNLGSIYMNTFDTIKADGKILIQNYQVSIVSSADTFNSFKNQYGFSTTTNQRVL